MIHRTDKRVHSFTRTDNRLIADPHLSPKAKMIMLYLLSKPDDWSVRVSDISKNTTYGVNGVRSAITELIEAGYMRRHVVRDESGRVTEHEYDVFEHPELSGAPKKFYVNREKMKKTQEHGNDSLENSSKNKDSLSKNVDSSQISLEHSFPDVDNGTLLTTEEELTNYSSLLTTDAEDGAPFFEEEKKKPDAGKSAAGFSKGFREDVERKRQDTRGFATGYDSSGTTDEDGSEVIVTLPARGQGRYYRIRKRDIHLWSRVYDLPVNTISRECRKMLQWLEDNPKRRKNDPKSFVTNWLSKTSAEHHGKRIQRTRGR